MPQKPEDAIRNRIMQEIAEPSQGHPGTYVPKRDKILEWTLYGILEQLQGISRGLAELAVEYKIKSR